MTAEAALHNSRRHCALLVLIAMALAVQSTLAGSPDSWVPARWQGGPLELQRRAQEKTLPADPSLRETILRWLIARVVIVGCGHGLRYVFEVRV